MATVHKFGRNPAVGNGVWEDVWNRGGVYAWHTAGFTLLVSSSTAGDTAAGAGARTITVEGLATDLSTMSETISMLGTTTSTGGSTFFRVNRAYVATCGTYATLTGGSNQGLITINTSTGGAVAGLRTDTGTGTVGLGQTELARYTVPARKVAYIPSIHISVDSGKPARVVMFKRLDATTVAAPFSPKRLVIDFDAVAGTEDLRPKEPLGPFFAGTDLWWAAKGDGAQTEVSVDFEIELVTG